MFAVVLIAICSGVVFALWNWMKPRHKAPPVYPGALPLIGHSYLVPGNPLHFWQFEKKFFNFTLKNGGVVELRVGLHSLYVLTNPDDSLKVANTCLEKPYFYNFGKEMYNNGLVTASVSKWKPHRRLLNPAFNLQVLNTFVAEFNTQSRNLVSLLAAEVGKDPFNVQQYVINQLLKTVFHTSLGVNEQAQDVQDIENYTHATEDLIALFVERLKNIWLHLPFIFNWSTLKTKQDKLMKVTKDIMNKVINKRKLELKASNDLKENTTPTQVPDKYKTLLDQMLDLADEQGAFTDDEIREHLDTIVAAASDTSSAAVAYTLLYIGTYPDVQGRIYNEIQTVLGNQDRDFTKEDLSQLLYLEAVLKESLRLYPPVPIVARRIQSDVQLKDYILPAGSSCLIGLYGINRHPMWGADAEQFKPERWLDPSSLPDNPNAFASFSIGRRNCIGRLYSMIVIKTMLAHIIRKYRVTGDIHTIPTQSHFFIKPATDQQIRLEIRT